MRSFINHGAIAAAAATATASTAFLLTFPIATSGYLCSTTTLSDSYTNHHQMKSIRRSSSSSSSSSSGNNRCERKQYYHEKRMGKWGTTTPRTCITTTTTPSTTIARSVSYSADGRGIMDNDENDWVDVATNKASQLFDSTNGVFIPTTITTAADTSSSSSSIRTIDGYEYYDDDEYNYYNQEEIATEQELDRKKQQLKERQRMLQLQEQQLKKKQQEEESLLLSGTATTAVADSVYTTFTVELPLVVGGSSSRKALSATDSSSSSTSTSSSSTGIGLTLGQIVPGRIFSSYELDCDSITIQLKPTVAEIEAEDSDTRQQRDRIDCTKLKLYLDNNFSGIIVTSVVKYTHAWNVGIRPGDIVSAVSATIGDAMWPKSTLDGVKSALLSRQKTVFVGNNQRTIQFQIQRLVSYSGQEQKQEQKQVSEKQGTAAPAVVKTESNQYELTIRRPLGFYIRESTDGSGFVEVASISDNASNLVQYGVRVGDKIIAIGSSLGDQLRPASSTVEGVIAACTGRLPGQPVTIRFERPLVNQNIPTVSTTSMTASSTATIGVVTEREDAMQLPVAGPASVVDASDNRKISSASGTTSKSTSAAAGTKPLDVEELRSRCRTILKRYANEDATGVTVGPKTSLEKFPALVADKVVDALASASVEMDCYTLVLIMNAYLLGGKPKDAIQIFEASTGFAGDGSINTLPAIIHGKNEGSRIYPTESSLNLYTCTALLRALSSLNDFTSVQRVLLAMEGKSGETLVGDENAIEVAPWPWTGSLGSLRPDTVCYNIAIAAAEKVGGTKAIDDAIELFNRMSPPPSTRSSISTGKTSLVRNANKSAVTVDRQPQQNAVTFNTIISALCNEGRATEALEMFDRMAQHGLRPDKFTYTSLIKVCKSDTDLEELLYDMRERGIQGDIVTYNTIIKSLCDKRQWTKATKRISEMESKNISPDSTTYGLLMSGMLKQGKANACLTLFETACSSSRTAQFTQNVYLYTIAISAASKLGDHQRALDYISRMNASGVKPNLKTLTAVMVACLTSRQPGLAVEVFNRIDNPDGYAISQGIRALCEHGDIEQATIILLQKQKPSIITGKQIMYNYYTFLRSALLREQYDHSRNVFQDLLRKGYIPNKAIYTSFIDVFKLNTLLNTNKRDNKSMNKSTIKHFIERNREVDMKRFEFLLFVVDSLERRGLPLEVYLYDAIVALGNELHGIPQRIVSLMSDVKRTMSSATSTDPQLILTMESEVKIAAENDEVKMESSVTNSRIKKKWISWEDLLQDYNNSFPKNIVQNEENLTSDSLPPLRVRTSSLLTPATATKTKDNRTTTRIVKKANLSSLPIVKRQFQTQKKNTSPQQQ